MKCRNFTLVVALLGLISCDGVSPQLADPAAEVCLLNAASAPAVGLVQSGGVDGGGQVTFDCGVPEYLPEGPNYLEKVRELRAAGFRRCDPYIRTDTWSDPDGDGLENYVVTDRYCRTGSAAIRIEIIGEALGDGSGYSADQMIVIEETI